MIRKLFIVKQIAPRKLFAHKKQSKFVELYEEEKIYIREPYFAIYFVCASMCTYLHVSIINSD